MMTRIIGNFGIAALLSACVSTAPLTTAKPAAKAAQASAPTTTKGATTKPAAAQTTPARPKPTAPAATPTPVAAAGTEIEKSNEIVTPVATETPILIAPKPETKKTYSNLWDRMRAGFALAPMEGPVVARHEQWFVNNSDYIERMLQRANLYLFYIVEEVEKRGLPMEIALLPAIESAYQPHAYSRARASGLWQFIPSTGRLYGLKSDWWYDGRRDVMASTKAALDYLEKLRNDFNGDWHLALAAYNCGEGKVARLMAYNRSRGLPTSFQDLKLPRETQHYVPKLIAMANIVAGPAKYGLQLRDIPNSPYFVQVDAGSQIDLGVVAKLTNLSLDDLYAMNPGFNRWATSPDGPHHLLIPAESKDALLEGLNDLPPEERMQWARHEVKRGDTLGRIAYRYGVSTEAIRTANNLRANQLRVGQDLLIPVSGRKLVITQQPAQKTASQTAPQTAKAQEGKVRITHQVRAGDTLTGIARKYNVYVDQLRKWNLMDANDVLKTGQKLLIWISPGAAAALDSEKQTAG